MRGKRKWVRGPWGVAVAEEVARALEIRRRAVPAEFRDELLRVPLCPVSKGMGTREEDSWISTDTVDRQGDVVLPVGMDDRAFALNPVVTWQHAYDQPAVGRSVWRRLARRGAGQGIIARTRYPPLPAGWPVCQPWLPDTAWNLLSQGLLTGKSIGFVALKARSPTREELRVRPDWAGARRVITDWLLVEYACVTLPANPETLLAEPSTVEDLAGAGQRLGDLLAGQPDAIP